MAGAAEYYPSQVECQKKGCPRDAFLGLAEDGYVVGVPAGNYTKSVKNKKYAIAGVNLLRDEPQLCNNISEMWRKLMLDEKDKEKNHNNQLEVVAALWKNGDIKPIV